MRYAVLLFGVALAAQQIALALPCRAAEPAVMVAVERCNDNVAGGLEAQVRTMRAHPPGDSDAENRLAELNASISDLSREDEVLQAECGTHGEVNPFISEIRVTQGLAYALQADILSQRFAKTCPAAERRVTAGLVAQAWRSIARAIPASGVLPPGALDLKPEIERRAAAADLKLPSFFDATDYWMRTVQTAGSEAARSCPQ